MPRHHRDESERLSSLIEFDNRLRWVERGRQAYELARGQCRRRWSPEQPSSTIRQHPGGVRGIALVARDRPDLPMRANRRPHTSQLAVVVLIDDALRCTLGTGVIATSARKEERTGESWSCAVIDRGPWRAVEERERIFERFVRGSTARRAADPTRGGGAAACEGAVSRTRPRSKHIAEATRAARGSTAMGRPSARASFAISIPASWRSSSPVS